MAAVAMAVPVLRGKVEDLRRFIQETLGPRSAECEEAARRLGITGERIWLQESPEGATAIIYLEADDPERAMQRWAAAETPFDRWFKQRSQEIFGIDFGQMSPLPEQVLAWEAR
jgi:hypothetical protein